MTATAEPDVVLTPAGPPAEPDGYVRLPAGVERRVRANHAWIRRESEAPWLVEAAGAAPLPALDVRVLGPARAEAFETEHPVPGCEPYRHARLVTDAELLVRPA